MRPAALSSSSSDSNTLGTTSITRGPMGSVYGKLTMISNILTSLFPLWVLSAVVLALVRPATLAWLKGDIITVFVGATMVFTGMTLEVDDFVKILKQPSQVALGFLCQFSIMPGLAFWISRALNLPADIAAGLILLGCCPGGTSSNLVTLIAKGDVALSVLMTTVSTVAAAAVTPALVSVLAGSLVRVNGIGLAVSTLQVVMGPIIAGLAINRFLPRVSQWSQVVTPLLSVFIVSLICGSIVAQTASVAAKAGPVVFAAVTLLHGGGFLVGWAVPKLLGYGERVARTTSIETGIQSSALAVVLATRHFPNPVLSALPCALSGTCQSIMGSILANTWSQISIQEDSDSLSDLEDPTAPLSPAKIRLLWEKYDINDDGELCKDELRQLLIGCYTEQMEAVRETAAAQDRRLRGLSRARAYFQFRSSRNGLRAVLKATSNLGIRACQQAIRDLQQGRSEEVDDIYRTLDADGDGRVSREDFLALAPSVIQRSFLPRAP